MNDAVLVSALAHILREPDTWDQAKWAVEKPCGTAFCLAGHITQLAGMQLDREEVDWDAYDRPTYSQVIDEFGTPFTIQHAAVRLLGISFDEAYGLFHPHNDFDDLIQAGALVSGLDPDVLRDKVYDEAGHKP